VTVAYWILAGLLALAFVFSGIFKILQSKEQLRSKGMEWTVDYSQNAIRGIGAAEILGAVGLIVPPLTGIAPVLAPIAAVGLLVIMVGAIRAHLKRGGTFIPNIVLGFLAIVVAILGIIVWV
jgi:uncharacterized membrane protein YphA (DoxX/SURF4 family)